MVDMNLMVEIASDEVFAEAYEWLCERRKDYHHNADVWDVRWRWADLKTQLQEQLLAGQYRLGTVERIETPEKTVEVWPALDALVLKAVAIVLSRRLGTVFSRSCYHPAGHGGAKKAVRDVAGHLPENRFVFRSDVRSYYASIDHEVLFAQLKQHIDDPRVLDLLWQYMRRTVCDGGRYEDVTVGIGLGCPLSPLMGALYLTPVDDAMAETGVFYARFMDDWVVLAPTRWKLREAIRRVNQGLAGLEVQQHPDKTFIGRVNRGFDFLGYTFQTTGLVGVARQTVERFVERATRLYEQGADAIRIGKYVSKWLIWLRSGTAGVFDEWERTNQPWMVDGGGDGGTITELQRGPFPTYLIAMTLEIVPCGGRTSRVRRQTTPSGDSCPFLFLLGRKVQQKGSSLADGGPMPTISSIRSKPIRIHTRRSRSASSDTPRSRR